MNYIFCNSCFEIQDKKNPQKFYCTSCSHVFCAVCIQNYENFCLICKTTCKVLEINDQLPDMVKPFFGGLDSCQKKIKDIERIHTFQYNQNKMFIHKNRDWKSKYYKTKEECFKLSKMDKDITKRMKEECVLMERFKHAYKTNKISKDLLMQTPEVKLERQMLSPSTPDSSKTFSPQMKTPNSVESIRSHQSSLLNSNSTFKSRTPSGPSTSDRSRNLLKTGCSDDFKKLNFSPGVNNQKLAMRAVRDTQVTQISQKIAKLDSISQKPNVFRNVRKDLLESTMLQMQAASQRKYEHIRRSSLK